MSEPLVHLEGVVKSHAGREVLRMDDFTISAGEIVGLLGPTGAGKSTLLRLLTGVELPSSGTLRFQGHVFGATELPLSVRRRITLVFQRPLLLAGTVRDNVEFGVRVRRSAEKHALADEWIKRLRLDDLADRSARTLSGGETQLVALARALAFKPEVLLLDEPTSNLDPARVALVEAVIRDVQQQSTTVVMATHNLFQARRVATRVALLLEGRLVEDAPTETFFSSPRDPRTGAFVRGEMVY